MTTRSTLVVGLLLLVTVAVLFAQPSGVFSRLSVDSTAANALVVVGGITLGIDLHPQYGGVPDLAIVLVNASTCPPPLISYPSGIQGLGTLIACLYVESGAPQLGSAILGTARLQ